MWTAMVCSLPRIAVCSMRTSRHRRLLTLIALGADQKPQVKRLNALAGNERRSYCGRFGDSIRSREKALAGQCGVWITSGLPPTPHTDTKLRQKCPDAKVDFVSYRSNSFQRLARGIGQQPFLVAATREDRAHVATAHGDHYVSGFEHVVSPAFRLFRGDVDTLFCHRGDSCGVYMIGGFGAARVDRCLIPGVVGEESHGHLGAAGVVGAKEEHGWCRHHVLDLAVSAPVTWSGLPQLGQAELPAVVVIMLSGEGVNVGQCHVVTE